MQNPQGLKKEKLCNSILLSPLKIGKRAEKKCNFHTLLSPGVCCVRLLSVVLAPSSLFLLSFWIFFFALQVVSSSFLKLHFVWLTTVLLYSISLPTLLSIFSDTMKQWCGTVVWFSLIPFFAARKVLFSRIVLLRHNKLSLDGVVKRKVWRFVVTVLLCGYRGGGDYGGRLIERRYLLIMSPFSAFADFRVPCVEFFLLFVCHQGCAN